MYGQRVDATGDFWTVVGLAATVATAVATGFALIFSMWWRHVDAQRPEWVIHSGRSTWTDYDPLYSDTGSMLYARLANASQGIGLHVSVEGIGCRAEVQKLTDGRWVTKRIVAVLIPGDEFLIFAQCEPTDWDKAAIVILWREPGLWTRCQHRHSLRVPISSIATVPEYSPPYDDEQAEPSLPVMPDMTPDWPIPEPGWIARRRSLRQLRQQRG